MTWGAMEERRCWGRAFACENYHKPFYKARSEIEQGEGRWQTRMADGGWPLGSLLRDSSTSRPAMDEPLHQIDRPKPGERNRAGANDALRRRGEMRAGSEIEDSGDVADIESRVL